MDSEPVRIIIGGQYGSEGKGAAVAYLTDAQRCQAPVVVRTGGPQAGHSLRYNGQTFAMRQVPVAWGNEKADLCIGPGALIDIEVLRNEIDFVEKALYGGSGSPRKNRLVGRLWIDPNAAIVSEEHKRRESALGLSQSIGSTKEGVGACQADRVIRQAELAKDWAELRPYLADVPDLLWAEHKRGRPIFVESTQGFFLSLTRSGYYPNCTSRDITPAAVLNDAGIPTTWPHEIIMVLRTYPIRIAGPSGRMPKEITWEELAERTGGYVKPELTTVTKKTRRVSEWDYALARTAIRHCTPTAIWLSFADYWWPHLAGADRLDDEAEARVAFLEQDLGVPIKWVSLGFQQVVGRQPSIG